MLDLHPGVYSARFSARFGARFSARFGARFDFQASLGFRPHLGGKESKIYLFLSMGGAAQNLKMPENRAGH